MIQGMSVQSKSHGAGGDHVNEDSPSRDKCPRVVEASKCVSILISTFRNPITSLKENITILLV